MSNWNRRSVLAGAAASGLAGCATTAAPPPAAAPRLTGPPVYPIRARPDRIFDITVCLRPFRAAGPRLDAEMVGDKLVVHNYGHGGSGWSLSWGSADIVVARALAQGVQDVAVIGAGVLGLTAAITAQRAGAKVTIYAREFMPDVRSARATGTWSPDSRIALESAAPAGFAEQWEQMTRASFKRFRGYLGLPGDPVVWNDRYNLFDAPPGEGGRPRGHDPIGFVHYGSRVRDLTPRSEPVPAGEHPFNAAYVTRSSSMMFNIMSLGHLLTTDFLLAGGRIETMTFHTPADIARLKEKVVIDCTGYGARALWNDETIIPVRGQIAWLIPQPEVDYGLYTNGVSVLSRTDGIVVQVVGEEEAGWRDDQEVVRREESLEALEIVARAFRAA